MTHIRLTTIAELRTLPDGTTLTTTAGDQRLVLLRAYGRPHPDPVTGLWSLPRNPFTEWQVTEIHAELSGPAVDTPLTGEEAWLSTLADPHDTTQND